MPKIGFKHTKETKLKMSLKRKGVKHSFAHRKSLSLAQVGRVQSKSTREKISESKQGQGKGVKRSMNFRINLSIKRKGSNNPSWKGGKTTDNSKARRSLEIHLWREAVFTRDNYTCQKTGIRGGILRAHHIKNFSQYPELRCDISNGITLSEKAHKEFHKKYGIKNNTQEQLIEFLSI
jgi:5-methylcytosine-specific restriction endonuclease McrA